MARRYNGYFRPLNAYGMTTSNELCLLETYAREQFTGQGRIVDLGCWYGATTVSLARGLWSNNRATTHRAVEAFDLFRWEPWMEPAAEQVALPHRYGVGDSFYEDVRDLLSPYGSLVRVEKRDLLNYTPGPAPIEFLFVDAMKNWELAQSIVSGFFPLVLPGCGYVVQQDFAYYYPEIATNHLIMWYLRDHFEWVHHVPDSCSVVFACTAPLDPATLPAITPGMFSIDMIDEAYEYSARCVSPEARVHVEVAKLNFLIEQGHHAAACRQTSRLNSSLTALTAPMLECVSRVAAQAAESKVIGPDAHAAIGEWVAAALARTDAGALGRP